MLSLNLRRLFEITNNRLCRKYGPEGYALAETPACIDPSGFPPLHITTLNLGDRPCCSHSAAIDAGRMPKAAFSASMLFAYSVSSQPLLRNNQDTLHEYAR